jgi:hypothetical protein
MRRWLGLVTIIMCAVVGVSAQTSSRQNSQVRKHHVENKNAEKDISTASNFVPHTAYSYPLEDYKPGVVQVGPRTTFIKEGLSQDEVIRLLGKPSAISERHDQNVKVTIYEFERGDGRVFIAEFENGLLARSRTESREKNAEADR